MSNAEKVKLIKARIALLEHRGGNDKIIAKAKRQLKKFL